MRPGSSPSIDGQSVRRHGPSGGNAPPATRRQRDRRRDGDAMREQRERRDRRGSRRTPRGRARRPGRGGPRAARAAARSPRSRARTRPATAPPAANEPVSARMCRISTSPSAEAGSRPAIEARNSRVNPGTRSRLPIVTRSVGGDGHRGELAGGARGREDSGLPESAAVRSRGVIAYRFGAEDLGRVRFAISPLFEIAASLDVLRDPARHAMHAPWVATARERLAGLDLVAARGRRARRRPLPAGLRPSRRRSARGPASPPSSPASGRRRRAQVARDLEWAYEGALPPAAARCCSTTRRAAWPSSRSS